jgi:hypothetical protein
MAKFVYHVTYNTGVFSISGTRPLQWGSEELETSWEYNWVATRGTYENLVGIRMLSDLRRNSKCKIHDRFRERLSQRYNLE